MDSQLLEQKARRLLGEAFRECGGKPHRDAFSLEQHRIATRAICAAFTPLPGDDLELVVARAIERAAREHGMRFGRAGSMPTSEESKAEWAAQNSELLARAAIAAITSFRVIGGEQEEGMGDPSGNPLSPSGSSPQAVSPASPHQSGAGSE